MPDPADTFRSNADTAPGVAAGSTAPAPILTTSGRSAAWKIHRLWLIGVLVVVIAAVVTDGLWRENAGSRVLVVADAPGDTGQRIATAPVDGGTQRDPGVIRIATFNIASGTGLDETFDLTRTARSILLSGLAADQLSATRPVPTGGADLVGLQEARSGIWGESQVEQLAGMLGMSWVSSPSERRWWREHFGNGLLTRLPVESVVRIPLPQTQERGQRNVTLARVHWGGQVVRVLVTHIDRRVDQPAQLRFVAELFGSLEAPAIVMGDFNVTRDHPVLRELVERHGAVDATAGFPGAGDANRIDLIFVRGLVPVRAGMVNEGASDHPLIWAELRAGGR